MSFTKPAVSVLVSYYNGGKYLRGFLENFREQTICNKTQLIFASCLMNDEDRKIFIDFKESFPDGQVKMLELHELKTQSACWNLAIKESDAPLVCIWNIDDQRTKYSLENQVCSLESEPSSTVAVFGYFIISSEFKNNKGKLIDHSMYSKEEYERSMLLGPFFMFRKSVCPTIGYFDEQLKSGSDYDFAIRLAKHGTIKMINNVDGYFLDEGKGLSTGGNQLQPIERTVVELRYGLYDKVDKKYEQKAKEYRLMERLEFGAWTHA